MNPLFFLFVTLEPGISEQKTPLLLGRMETPPINTVPGWHRKFSLFTTYVLISRFADYILTCNLRQGTRPINSAFFSLPFTCYSWNQQKIWVHKECKGIREKTKALQCLRGACSSALKPLLSSSQALEMLDLS